MRVLLLVFVTAAALQADHIIESPLIGGSRSQTARITVLGVGESCEVTLGFRDINGVPPVDPELTVRPGRDQIVFHELNFNSVVSRLGQRYEFRARLTFAQPPDPGRPQCLPSLEIYEQLTKRTTTLASFRYPDGFILYDANGDYSASAWRLSRPQHESAGRIWRAHANRRTYRAATRRRHSRLQAVAPGCRPVHWLDKRS